MKRSKQIRLIMLGGLSAGVLTGCSQKPVITTAGVYTNNFYVPGAGYYHAPFRNWYALPYNHFDTQRQLYYFGGQWGAQPCLSITNISSPTPEAVQVVNEGSCAARRADGSPIPSIQPPVLISLVLTESRPT